MYTNLSSKLHLGSCLYIALKSEIDLEMTFSFIDTEIMKKNSVSRSISDLRSGLQIWDFVSLSAVPYTADSSQSSWVIYRSNEK